MEYKLLNEYDGFLWVGDRYDIYPTSLESAVNVLLDNGWEIAGGISSIGIAKRAFLVQAMIKRD